MAHDVVAVAVKMINSVIYAAQNSLDLGSQGISAKLGQLFFNSLFSESRHNAFRLSPQRDNSVVSVSKRVEVALSGGWISAIFCFEVVYPATLTTLVQAICDKANKIGFVARRKSIKNITVTRAAG